MYLTLSVLLLVLASASAFNNPRFGARAVKKMSLDMKNVRQLTVPCVMRLLNDTDLLLASSSLLCLSNARAAYGFF